MKVVFMAQAIKDTPSGMAQQFIELLNYQARANSKNCRAGASIVIISRSKSG
jgi:hypothetical protein